MNYFLALQTLQAVNPDVSLTLLAPELIISITGVLVMMFDAFTHRADRPWLTGGLSLAGILAAAASCVWLWRMPAGLPTSAYNGMIVLDPMRLSFTFVFLVVAGLTVLLSMIWVEWEHLPAGEFHALLLFATVGMMLMAAGGDLVIIFLGLELLSIATYVMAGFRRTDLRSNESSIKYFILGSFSSAFLLYGIALVYGGSALLSGGTLAAGTTNIHELALRVTADRGTAFPALLYAGAALLLVGFGFKIATAPFHVWTPDVYEGAPTPVTAFMAAGPKAAGFAGFMRVFLFGFPFVAAVTASNAAPVHDAWVNVLYVLAILTMSVGNLAALVQSNVKRMLAYSSIAHAGYALVGFVAAGATNDEGQKYNAIAAVIFYLLAYAVMNLGAFAVVTLIARAGDRRTEIEDYNGIGFRAPALAAALTLFMLSLLGVPLTAGFMGKVMVFRAALNLSGTNAKYTALVIVGVLNTAVSVYYYLRLVVVMYFRERTTAWTPPRVPASIAIALVLTIAAVLYLGIFPGRVLDALRGPQSTISQMRP